MGRYRYKGEAELLIVNSLDGPLVLDQDDEVSLPDDDESLEGHPLFDPVEPGEPVTPKRRRKKATDEDPHNDEDPQTPVPDEPSA